MCSQPSWRGPSLKCGEGESIWTCFSPRSSTVVTQRKRVSHTKLGAHRKIKLTVANSRCGSPGQKSNCIILLALPYPRVEPKCVVSFWENLCKFQRFVAIHESFLHEIWGAWCYSVASVSNLQKFSRQKSFFHQFAKVFSHKSPTTRYVHWSLPENVCRQERIRTSD